jgi:polysaccharide pyruvyl transferase WcaK-like protein
MSGPKIGITGSYGGMNLGDEAILQSMIEQVRREMPGAEITVFSRNAEDTKRRHKVERAVPVRKLSRAEVVPEVERLDLLLFGGGGILYDAEARVYLREVLIAKEHGVSRTVTVLAWLLKHPSKIVPIIGSANPANIVDAAKADDVDLTREQWYRILIAARGKALP